MSVTALIDELRAMGVPDAAIPSVMAWAEAREQEASRAPRARVQHPPEETRNRVSSLEWRSLREGAFCRDGFLCVYCGSDGDGRALHADHVNPVSRGGPSSLENLATACWRCNLSKGDRTPKEWGHS